MIGRYSAICLALFALSLIGLGAYLIYPAACPLAVGLLIWLDLTRKERP